MAKGRRTLTAVALGVATLALTGVAGGGTAASVATSGTYIAVYKDTVVDGPTKTAALGQKHGFSKKFDYATLKGFAATMTDVQAAAVRAEPDVAYVVADQPVHSDALVALKAGELVPPGIKRIGAATATQVHGASTIAVAVLDTGIATHGNLSMVLGKNCVNAAAKAYDDNGHGTHVAGTIAATNAGTGVVGMTPGTKVYSVKVLDAFGNGTWSQVICGIDYVTANASKLKLKVANLSLSGAGANDNNCGNTNADPLHQAICRSTAAGVTYVVAAGNTGVAFTSTVPAAYPEVLTATAIGDTDGVPGHLGAAPACGVGGSDDALASFSNYASTTAEAAHTVAAPGACIYSTWLSGGYATLSGTSQAAPHVAGAVALCIGNGAVNGGCYGKTPAQIIQKIRADAAARMTASPGYGFTGDATNGLTSPFYGYLTWAGGY